MVKDYKEKAPCGMLIHYSVDSCADFVVYDDINGRGRWNKSEKCKRCSWKALCSPTSKEDELQKAYETGYVDGIRNGALESMKIVQEIAEEMGISVEVVEYGK